MIGEKVTLALGEKVTSSIIIMKLKANYFLP
jgi:hypothetical protein